MGMFQVKVQVANPADPQKSFTEDFWVDTGAALYSLIPENRLEEIGLRPTKARDLILADGRRDRRRLGEAFLTLPSLNETMTCPVVFGQPGSLYLLGATALENFCVTADPAAQQLKPMAAIIGGFWAPRAED